MCWATIQDSVLDQAGRRRRTSILSDRSEKKAPSQSTLRKIQSVMVFSRSHGLYGDDLTESNDSTSSLVDFEIWRHEPHGKEECCCDTHKEDGPLDTSTVGSLSNSNKRGIPTGEMKCTYPQRKDQQDFDSTKEYPESEGGQRCFPCTPFTDPQSAFFGSSRGPLVPHTETRRP